MLIPFGACRLKHVFHGTRDADNFELGAGRQIGVLDVSLKAPLDLEHLVESLRWT